MPIVKNMMDDMIISSTTTSSPVTKSTSHNPKLIYIAENFAMRVQIANGGFRLTISGLDTNGSNWSLILPSHVV